MMTTTRTVSGAPPRGAVVITGASTGIGRACALSLDALGFRVFAGVRQAEDAQSLRRAGSARLTPVFLNVTDEQSIAAAVAEVAREVGDAGLAGLVNNAGVEQHPEAQRKRGSLANSSGRTPRPVTTTAKSSRSLTDRAPASEITTVGA